MARLTAIEFGADTCAMARVAERRGQVELLDVEMIDPAAFPGGESFTVVLRQARRARKLPRRARVVMWGLPEGAHRKDPAVKPLLVRLESAGFRIERVVSPCNALAALARVRSPRGEGATCWLAINRAGVAIVVVRPGKQLFAHSFLWDSNLGASGSQARLLQRYSLVSFLAPHVKRAMAEARRQGTPVEALVTCGNLPDLRALTMPLIEELDIEVETLDSLDGLIVKPELVDRFAEAAPSIRLACAAVVARPSRAQATPPQASERRLRVVLLAAAALIALAAIGFAWYQRSERGSPASSRVTVGQPTAGNAPVGQPTAGNAPVGQPTTGNAPVGQPTAANFPHPPEHPRPTDR